MDDRWLSLSIGCVAALLSALGVVLARRPVHSALFLLLHSLSIAALFLCLSADFVAMGQVTVYSGAIVVLFLFVVLLLPDGGRERRAGSQRIVVALVAGAITLLAMFAAMYAALRGGTGPTADDSAFAVAALARNLFGPQLIPFELTGVLLLVAIVGGVSLWHRQGPERKR